MSDKRMKMVVVIVNWNGKKLLPVCLKSLQNQTYKRFKIILVDNGSVDGSVKYVKDNFPEVQVIELLENTGFAQGNNIGISMALQSERVESIVLLNNDTRVESDFLEKLVGAVDDKSRKEKKQQKKDKTIINPPSRPRRTRQVDQHTGKIGALAPKMFLWQNGSVNFAGKVDEKNKLIDAVGAKISLDGRGYNIGHGEIDRGQYDKKQEVFGFCGGAVLLRRDALEDVVVSQKSKVNPTSLSHFAEATRDKRLRGARSQKLKFRSEKYVQRTVGLKIEDVDNEETVEYQEYFDESFFAYYEDADLSWRMRLRGWKILTVPEAVVWHLHSATADTIKSKTFKAYYLNRNRFFMMIKNFPGDLLWRGLKLVPKSYFENSSKGGDKNKIIGDDNRRIKTKTKLYTEIGRKIVMIWVMAKVGCSLFLNSWRLWQERGYIQGRRKIDLKELQKWF